MKRITKYLLLSTLMLMVSLLVVSCSQWDTPYVSLDDSKYNVSVKFDANGGMFAGTKDVYVVDVFSLENQKSDANGMKEISLIQPDNSKRGDRAFEVSKTDYFLAGWYQERTPRVNDNGEALDDYGVPTSKSGRPQGYVYSDKWDFEKDSLKVDPNKSYTSSESVLTLYAGWVPYFKYEFYVQSEDKSSFELISTSHMIELKVPEWNEQTGKINMFKFPSIDGKTFDAAYLTEDMSESVSGVITGTVDYDKGISTTETIKIYTKWLDGEWFRIHTAKQFFDNSRLGGNYIICADLDFSSTVWSPVLTKGVFTGTILGNGYKFSNISVVQADNTQMSSGLFGTISPEANISDLTFENVTYTIEAGSRKQGASIGLLAGTINEGAAFDDVTVSGKLLISPKCYPQAEYNVGLLCGNCLYYDGINYTIDCQYSEETDNNPVTFEVDTTSGRVNLTFKN